MVILGREIIHAIIIMPKKVSYLENTVCSGKFTSVI